MALLKQIKISESTKAELDSLKTEEETYNTVISNLLKENAKLKADNERLFNIAENLSSKN